MPLAKALASQDVIWIDVLNGSDAELKDVHETTGLKVPSLASLSEIEYSSRMRHSGDALPRPEAS